MSSLCWCWHNTAWFWVTMHNWQILLWFIHCISLALFCTLVSVFLCIAFTSPFVVWMALGWFTAPIVVFIITTMSVYSLLLSLHASDVAMFASFLKERSSWSIEPAVCVLGRWLSWSASCCFKTCSFVCGAIYLMLAYVRSHLAVSMFRLDGGSDCYVCACFQVEGGSCLFYRNAKV